jgi:hypothetical protein
MKEYVPGWVNVYESWPLVLNDDWNAVHAGSSDGPASPWTLCETVLPSKSQVTFSPVLTDTAGGLHVLDVVVLTTASAMGSDAAATLTPPTTQPTASRPITTRTAPPLR